MIVSGDAQLSPNEPDVATALSRVRRKVRTELL